MSSSGYGRFAAASIAVLAILSPALADAPGVLWQTTSQTIMPGMPYNPPPNTGTLCTKREWTRPPPPPPGQTCTTSNFQRVDNKVTWDTQCTGRMAMTGRGEITFTSDSAYTGVIAFAAEGMTVTINLSGTRIGDCDNPIG
jgi:hypothetical protein